LPYAGDSCWLSLERRGRGPVAQVEAQAALAGANAGASSTATQIPDRVSTRRCNGSGWRPFWRRRQIAARLQTIASAVVPASPEPRTIRSGKFYPSSLLTWCAAGQEHRRARTGFCRKLERRPCYRRLRYRVGALLHFLTSPPSQVLPFQNMSGDPDQEYFADAWRRTLRPRCRAMVCCS